MKEKVFRKIVKHKNIVIIVFLLLALGSALCKQLVDVNYDMNSYLPEDSASTVSLDVMQSEFNSGIPNARVMIKNVTVAGALKYKEKIAAVDGVTDVMWLDDAFDVKQPLEACDKSVIETYYKDDSALITVTIEDDKRLSAVNEIREIIGKDNAMTGSAVDTATATQSTTKEIKKIAMIAVPLVLLILFLTTTSWVEPFLILGTIGIAVIINGGTNLIFGQISFVTNAAGSILQLAVSLDYSVFLIHRFKEVMAENPERDTHDVMVDALCQSTSSILSSGLTTVIGFLALCLMQFKIGPDMGLALAKGIFISLITVFVLTPALLLQFGRILSKFEHKSFMPEFKKFANFVTRHMVPMTIICILLIVPSFLAAGSNDFYYGSSKIFDSETKLGQDTALIEETFGKSTNYVVMVPKGDFEKETQMSEEINEIPQVKSIISYVDKAGSAVPTEYVDSSTLSKLIGENYSRMVITIESDLEGDSTFAIVEELRSIADKYYSENYVAGEPVSTFDLKTTVTSDNLKVNLVAIFAVFLVLLLTMKSITLPVLLVAAIETAIWINLSVPYFRSQYLFYIAYLIISSIQLGATVDYAILFTDRFLEFRQIHGRHWAIKNTISTCATSILTSGSVLFIAGFTLGKITTHGVLSQLGMLLARGSFFSLIIVFFVLPGMLYIFDNLIEKTTKGITFNHVKGENYE